MKRCRHCGYRERERGVRFGERVIPVQKFALGYARLEYLVKALKTYKDKLVATGGLESKGAQRALVDVCAVQGWIRHEANKLQDEGAKYLD